jgi:cell division control protein 6
VSHYRSVFKDETKLDINYIPSRLPHRDKELRLLTEFFNFAVQAPGKMGQRALIVGDVGAGKTALSQRFGTDITHRALAHNTALRYVHVNCRECRGSLFLILQHVVSVFHPNFPKRGYSPEELLNTIQQVLDDENAYVILTLDEFESLIEHEGTEAVYELTRIQETRQTKPQRLSLICILRNLNSIIQLDASTRSTLQSNIIRLEKYSMQQLIDILDDRVNLAFQPLTVQDDTVNLIGEIVFSEGSNARFGIELLWRAGKYADAEDNGNVVPEYVRKAVSSIIPTMPRSELATLNLHEKLFLLGIARRFKGNQKANISLAESEQAYSVVCEEFGEKPHSHTQLWKYLQSLSVNEIVKTEVSTSGTRGRSTFICLPRISADELEKELAILLQQEKA